MLGRCLAAFLLVTIACARHEQASPPPTTAPPAASDPAVDRLLKGFADAILAKDYAQAYDAIALERRPTLPLAEFQEAIAHYREGYEGSLRASVRVEPYDPDGASLLPDEFKGRIASEAIVEFEPGGDEEGFSVLVWIVIEAGVPRLASFYVGD